MSSVDFQLFQGKRCLVTGGAGFIGSHVAQSLLELGADVLVADTLYPDCGANLANLKKVEGKAELNIVDISDRQAMLSLVRDSDYLFNLAGRTSHLDSMRDPVSDLESNSLGQVQLLDLVKDENPSIRIVYASTRQIYGRPNYLPVDESHPLKPTDVNGINKLSGESFHRLYGELFGINVTILRLTNTYGPGMRVRDARQTFLGIWVKNVVQRTSFSIFGDGEQKRDFNYVSDVVEAILLSATTDAAIGTTINLGGSEVLSLRSVAQELVRLEPGARFDIIPFPPDRLAIDIGDYFGSWELANQLLGWSPVVSISEGLERTLAYYKEFGDLYW